MARRKSKSDAVPSDATSNKPGAVRWVNYRLSPEDTPVILSDADNVAELATRLARLFASGADFSVRYVPARKNFSAFAISVAGSDDGVRIGISAFGGSVWQAIASVLYKCDIYAAQPEKFTESGAGMVIG